MFVSNTIQVRVAEKMESAYPFFFAQHNTTTNNDYKFAPCFFDNYDFIEMALHNSDGSMEADNLCQWKEGAQVDSGHEEAYTNNGFQNEYDHDDDADLITTKTRKDRSKTLISERKRRFRMKEELYQLRSLVPNITKMDKASIIADAIVYMKDLKSQAKKLEEEICNLESSLKEDQILLQVPGVHHKSTSTIMQVELGSPDAAVVRGKITQVNVHQVGERRFYVKVEGRMGDGSTASSLYSAMESLFCFCVESSNFSINSLGFAFAVTLKIGDLSKVMMDASSTKLWVTSALLKEVRSRMKSVKNIQKITKAMKMVAASKLRAVQVRTENSRGFWQPFVALLGDTPSVDVKKNVIVSITSDKGLCGGISSTSVRVSKALRKLTSGEKGKVQLVRDSKSSIEMNITELQKNPLNYTQVSVLADILKNVEYDALRIVYNKFHSVVSFVPTVSTILSPETVKKESEAGGRLGKLDNYEIGGGETKSEVLQNLTEFQFSCVLFNAVLENACSELGARMSAMDQLE
ncbi:ATP synthase subunit gamma, mitochondrial isoform X1 [Canna indica]|uniref:F-ATPase gamma subunit n=1 Tax=Canna indica TaxID=4628 RepID=A0AAQ3K3V4_9LILI|nr:ATP synthase subunit gamma, mitochondrial isoform X1 [Canna indica]